MLEMSITEKEIQDRMMSLSYSDKTAFVHFPKIKLTRLTCCILCTCILTKIERAHEAAPPTYA